MIWCMNEGQLQTVSDACPNARFHLVDCGDGYLLAAFNIMGLRVKIIVFSNDIKGGTVDWKNSWDECINLRKLYVYGPRVEEAKAIFRTPKDHLKIQKLDFFFVSDTEAKDVLDLCATGTKCVERFICLGTQLVLPSEPVFNIVRHGGKCILRGRRENGIIS